MKRIANIILLYLVVQVTVLGNDDYKKIFSLDGDWRFSIGDNSAWANPGYDDSGWERVRVPGPWENEGFHGYNGYAWYRVKIKISTAYEKQQLYIVLGYIDDVDEVYLNGQMIGSTGSFPPRYQTAYNAHRRYYMPNNYIHYGETNTLAIRVYDSHMGGGIVKGDVGIYKDRYSLALDLNLQGEWKFFPGDKLEWKEHSATDPDWKKIFVPGFWEDQGYRDYDGYAWYRKSVEVPGHLARKPMVAVLGKIDDLDQLYINGKLIAGTGDFKKNAYKLQAHGHYNEFRGYYIPDGHLRPGKNTFAVRVYDDRGGGGIYKGPIGLVTQENYIQFWRNRK
jgi:sialate O-acetylesterase